MSIRVVKPGDKSKQGNAYCPQCGEKVILPNSWGDPPKCPHCDVPYAPISRIPVYR